MPVVIHRLPRHQLHTMSAEALKVRRLRQLAIEPRRRNLQHIRSARHRIFNFDDRSKLAAELRAILVRHTVRTIRRRSRSRPIDKHAQRAVLTADPRTSTSTTSSPLELATRSAICRTLSRSNAMFSAICASVAAPAHSNDSAPTKKWAFAHWCASTILALRHNSIHHQLYAALSENTNHRGAAKPVETP